MSLSRIPGDENLYVGGQVLNLHSHIPISKISDSFTSTSSEVLTDTRDSIPLSPTVPLITKYLSYCPVFPIPAFLSVFSFPSIIHSLTNTHLRIFTLRRRSALEKTGITHIVSVLKYDFKDFEDWGKYEHLSVEVDDVEDENLLGEFERTGAWIENAFKEGQDGKKGGVLVHW